MTKEQYQKTIDRFRVYYNKIISPALSKLEKRRKRMRNIFFLTIVLFLLIVYLLIIAEVPALTLFALIPITILGSMTYYRIKAFKAEFKPKIIQLILNFIDEEIEAGNDRRLLEIEQKIQAYNIQIIEFQKEISRKKQKLYAKIEQRLDDIARNIDSGMEHEVIDVVKERVLLLEEELDDIKKKIRHAIATPDGNSQKRIAEMDADRLVIERKLQTIKLSFEEGLEEQINYAEKQIRILDIRNQVLKKRMGQHLKAKLVYQYNQKISKSTFRDSGIFNLSPTIYEGEDYISGYIGTATFEMSELYVARLSPVRAIYETIFRGIFFKANFFYDVGGGLVVFIPQEERQELSETIRGITSQGGQRINLPTKEFDKAFVVYAEQGVEIDSLLSKNAFKTILDYRKRSGKKIYVSFLNGYVNIAITESKDILEPNIFKSNANFKLIREYFEDILLIMSIVEDFDSNH
ncbi:MAG: DUF3137 domain-containing protein [Saprospiraceae bacterium]